MCCQILLEWYFLKTKNSCRIPIKICFSLNSVRDQILQLSSANNISYRWVWNTNGKREILHCFIARFDHGHNLRPVGRIFKLERHDQHDPKVGEARLYFLLRFLQNVYIFIQFPKKLGRHVPPRPPLYLRACKVI